MNTVPIWKGTLKEWRTAMGLTQPQAAEVLDCGARRIQAIEAGEGGYRLTRPDLVCMAIEFADASKREHSRRVELVGGCYGC